MLYTSHYHSPLGDVTLAAKDGALVGLWIEGQKYFLGRIGEAVAEDGGAAPLARASDWLDRYFGGEKPLAGELPLAPAGSEFARSVWRILCEIPYGETVAYGEIAARIARENGLARMSAQAVGGAVGHNPISIIIPCHRVVGAHGSLTGYAGGIDRKRWLLAHEGLDMSRYSVPARGTAL